MASLTPSRVPIEEHFYQVVHCQDIWQRGQMTLSRVLCDLKELHEALLILLHLRRCENMPQKLSLTF